MKNKYAAFAPKKPKSLGTVLPTVESLASSDRWAASNRAKNRAIAANAGLGKPSVVGGEDRYYESPERYAVIGKRGQVLWFRVGNDGLDHAEKGKLIL